MMCMIHKRLLSHRFQEKYIIREKYDDDDDDVTSRIPNTAN
jgi:hypothetical protein